MGLDPHALIADTDTVPVPDLGPADMELLVLPALVQLDGNVHVYDMPKIGGTLYVWLPPEHVVSFPVIGPGAGGGPVH